MKKTPSMPCKKSKPRTKKTHFQFYAPEARRVALVGTFNEWDDNTLPMKKDTKDLPDLPPRAASRCRRYR